MEQMAPELLGAPNNLLYKRVICLYTLLGNWKSQGYKTNIAQTISLKYISVQKLSPLIYVNLLHWRSKAP